MRISHENFYENRFQKINLWCHEIFFRNFDFKNGLKKNLRMKTKKSRPGPEIGYPTKVILKVFGLTSQIRKRGS